MKILHLCEHCNEEYELELSDGVYNFGDCPHCRRRNDVWIRVIVAEEET